MCNNAHSEEIQINLLSEGTKFSIHVHDQWTYYRVRVRSVCNNVHSEIVQNNLQAEGTRSVDIILQGKSV